MVTADIGRFAARFLLYMILRRSLARRSTARSNNNAEYVNEWKLCGGVSVHGALATKLKVRTSSTPVMEFLAIGDETDPLFQI